METCQQMTSQTGRTQHQKMGLYGEQGRSQEGRGYEPGLSRELQLLAQDTYIDTLTHTHTHIYIYIYLAFF